MSKVGGGKKGKKARDPASELSQEQLDEMRRLFDCFDSDGSGSVSTSELGEVLEQMGVKVSEERLKAMVKEVDGKDSRH